jgi:hypothetical protein
MAQMCDGACAHCGTTTCWHSAASRSARTLEDKQLLLAQDRKQRDAHFWQYGVCVAQRRALLSADCARLHREAQHCRPFAVDGPAPTSCAEDHALPLAYRLWTLDRRRGLHVRCAHCHLMQGPLESRHTAPFAPYHPTLLPEIMVGCCLRQTLFNVLSAYEGFSDRECFVGVMSWRDFCLAVKAMASLLQVRFAAAPPKLLRLRWSGLTQTANQYVQYFAALLCGLGVLIVEDHACTDMDTVLFPSDSSVECAGPFIFEHRCPSGDSTCLVLSTSGSTSSPKPVVLTASEVHAQVLGWQCVPIKSPSANHTPRQGGCITEACS